MCRPENSSQEANKAQATGERDRQYRRVSLPYQGIAALQRF
jgi:hypothetical protein